MNFDEPREMVWESIQKGMPDTNSKVRQLNPWKKWMSVAAMFLITFGLGFWFASQQNIIDEPRVGEELAAISLDEVEHYYTHQIETHTVSLESYKKIQPELYDEFIEELNLLDSVYLELRLALDQNEDNEQIMNLMILNLQLRIDILRRQKGIMESIDKRKKQEYGKDLI